MRAFVAYFILLAATASAGESTTSADAIMARVAVNQDAAQSARAQFVYRQQVAIHLRDARSRLVRKEISEYQVTPAAQKTHKELVSFSGSYLKGPAMVSYAESGKSDQDGFREQGDSHLAHNLRDDLTGDGKSKDGFAPDLFPLTASEQRKYSFVLKGEETCRGTEVYRIIFRPKRKTPLLQSDEDDTVWSGEALITKADSQPMVITTRLAKRVPFLVRTALGTNVPGLGFSIQYAKFEEGVWFPVSYGSEFRVHVLFAYSRQVAISVVNSDFRRADVQSAVEFEKAQ